MRKLTGELEICQKKRSDPTDLPISLAYSITRQIHTISPVNTEGHTISFFTSYRKAEEGTGKWPVRM